MRGYFKYYLGLGPFVAFGVVGLLGSGLQGAAVPGVTAPPAGVVKAPSDQKTPNIDEKTVQQGRTVEYQTPDSYHLPSQGSPTIKLRIGNTTSEGLLVVVVSQAEPTRIKSVQYAPPKFSVPQNVSSYFSTVVEQYVTPTDLVAIALVKPVLHVLTADISAIEQENKEVAAIKAQADKLLKNGMMTMWRISRLNAGTTKTYVYVDIQGAQSIKVADKMKKVLPGGIPKLVPNAPVQSGFLSEIDFAEWHQPATLQHGKNRFIKEPIFLCERFGTCSLDLKRLGKVTPSSVLRMTKSP